MMMVYLREVCCFWQHAWIQALLVQSGNTAQKLCSCTRARALLEDKCEDTTAAAGTFHADAAEHFCRHLRTCQTEGQQQERCEHVALHSVVTETGSRS
jgi:hypothetical protein